MLNRGKSKTTTIQLARIFEITDAHYHVVNSNGRLYWIPKKHSVISAALNDLVELNLRTEHWHREWWIQSIVEQSIIHTEPQN